MAAIILFYRSTPLTLLAWNLIPHLGLYSGQSDGNMRTLCLLAGL
jgi:hypothetical protein